MNRYLIELSAKSCNLSLLRSFLQPLMKQIGFLDKETYHIVLAVDEACSNIIRYAYRKTGTKKCCLDEKNKIRVLVEVYLKKIKIKIRDYGIKCDPKKIRGRKLSQLKPGGLGVHLIHGCMDEVVFNTKFKQGTELILTKKIKSSSGKS